MFGIGFPELIVILVIALLVLGPSRLPEVARALGRAMGEFRRATSDITQELRDTHRMIEEEARAAEQQVKQAKTAAQPPAGAEARTQAGEKDAPRGS